MPLHKVYILLGSNLGRRKSFLTKAKKQISLHCGTIEKESAVYETAAWGKINQNAFLNQIILIKTNLVPDALMNRLLDIEKELGRIRIEKFGPRTIDLDILLYDHLVHHSKTVTLPHPSIQDRRFVLVPLNELSPGIIHPVLKKTVARLLKECPDQLQVKQINT